MHRGSGEVQQERHPQSHPCPLLRRARTAPRAQKLGRSRPEKKRHGGMTTNTKGAFALSSLHPCSMARRASKHFFPLSIVHPSSSGMFYGKHRVIRLNCVRTGDFEEGRRQETDGKTQRSRPITSTTWRSKEPLYSARQTRHEVPHGDVHDCKIGYARSALT